MATLIKRIEKDYLLKVLYDEQLAVMYFRNRFEYILLLDRPPAKDEIVFRADRSIDNLKVRNRMELKFDYRGQMILFSAEVREIQKEFITCTVPEFLYKNLDRSYSRVHIPSELKVQFGFSGDRYNLSFPKIMEFEPEAIGEVFRKFDPRNLSGLIDGMAEWVKDYADGYRLVIFKDTKPARIEEQVVAKTGKTLYLPVTTASFPQTDPHPRKRLITEEIFKDYLKSTGVDSALVDNACTRFVKAKSSSGIFSDAWIPVLFQEYVIGYVHVWVDKEGKRPFDYEMLEVLYQFVKVLAHSLKINGYFEQGKLKNEPFEGKVIDISASGLLFAYPRSNLVSSLLLDTNLTVRLITPRRTIVTAAKIVRRFTDTMVGYFGCCFFDMEPEDIRFLFEFLYGKPFTGEDVAFFYGQV